jgi:hypothetical protein
LFPQRATHTSAIGIQTAALEDVHRPLMRFSLLASKNSRMQTFTPPALERAPAI